MIGWSYNVLKYSQPYFRSCWIALRFPRAIYKQYKMTLYFFPKYLFLFHILFSLVVRQHLPNSYHYISAVPRRFLKAAKNSSDFFVLIDFFFSPSWLFIRTKLFFTRSLTSRIRIKIRVNILYLDSNFDTSQYYLRSSPTPPIIPALIALYNFKGFSCGMFSLLFCFSDLFLDYVLFYFSIINTTFSSFPSIESFLPSLLELFCFFFLVRYSVMNITIYVSSVHFLFIFI